MEHSTIECSSSSSNEISYRDICSRVYGMGTDDKTDCTCGGSSAYANEPDETILERLGALKEMFPKPIREACEKVLDRTTRGLTGLLLNSVWIAFISGVILAVPLVLEIEREVGEEALRECHRRELMEAQRKD